jgi:hypothetical protein
MTSTLSSHPVRLTIETDPGRRTHRPVIDRACVGTAISDDILPARLTGASR